MFGEHITSTLVRMQNRELVFRCIAYNAHRMVNLLVIVRCFLQSHIDTTVPATNASKYTVRTSDTNTP
ncbi:MAG TPA: hypothetical protein VJ767_04935 [Nitrososphaeraceae archaeon]|nr:hypothetical protein [Nitrososphaeraceae archaeon]